MIIFNYLKEYFFNFMYWNEVNSFLYSLNTYWNFFELPGGIFDWALYTSELFTDFFVILISTGGDNYLGLKFLHLAGELRLLSIKFKNLKFTENYVQDLRKLVDKHVELIDAHHLLEKIFGWLVLWISISFAVSLCLITFQIRMVLS